MDLQGVPMTESFSNTLGRTHPIVLAAIAIVLGGVATILGAWFFQYGLGLKPCPLCLEQRYPYYFAIPLATLLILGVSVGSSRKVLLAGLFVIAVGMLWNAGLATYHAGVEWKFWPGPQECTGSFTPSGDLLEELKHIIPVRCDEAAWRFLGISLAGYNVLISLALAGVAAWGFWAGYRQPQLDD
jgi:disulfide bond formation protein DsbB